MSSITPLAFILGVLYGVYCYSVQDHKIWRVKRGISVLNTGIVTRTSTSRSLIECTKTCSGDSYFASLFYESTTKLCYCNNEVDPNLISSSAGQLVYGYRSLSYEACLELLYETDGDLFLDFPKSLYTLYTHCQQSLFQDWIVFQRRQDGSVNFTRPWLDYVNGFGNSSGEFWLGLEKIHQITRNKICELNITLEAEPNHPVLSFGYAHYDSFNISGAEDNYRLYVDGFNGTVGDSLTSRHSGQQFTTIDADHDVLDTDNCANLYKGGWWYKFCHKSNLNGRYYGGTHATLGDGVDWNDPWGGYYSLIKVEMKLRCLFNNE